MLKNKPNRYQIVTLISFMLKQKLHMEIIIKKDINQIANNGYHFRVEIKSNFTFTLNPSMFLKWMCNL